MAIKKINGFSLEENVYMVKGRLCRIFIPPVEGDEDLYWVEFMDSYEITIVHKNELKELKNGKLLYGKKNT